MQRIAERFRYSRGSLPSFISDALSKSSRSGSLPLLSPLIIVGGCASQSLFVGRSSTDSVASVTFVLSALPKNSHIDSNHRRLPESYLIGYQVILDPKQPLHHDGISSSAPSSGRSPRPCDDARHARPFLSDRTSTFYFAIEQRPPSFVATKRGFHFTPNQNEEKYCKARF